MARPLDERTKANLDVALEEACRNLPHGGDHVLRRKVAVRLLESARKGNTTLGGLSAVARTALIEVTRPEEIRLGRPRQARNLKLTWHC